MIRKICLLLMLATLACQAQNPISSEELNRRVEWQVRQLTQAPEYVAIRVVERKPESILTGFDSISVSLSARGQEKKIDLLISKDNKTLLSAYKMDLTIDPSAIEAEKAVQAEQQRLANLKTIDVSGRPVRGSATAKVTMVVFDDYQCPFCSHFHQTVLETLKTYGDKVKVIYKDFPLSSLHPWAERAAIDSECLASINGDAYWDYVDALHANYKQLASVSGVEGQLKAVDNLAKDMGAKHSLDAAKLSACIATQPREALAAAQAEGEKLGLDATPYVFIDGEVLEGAVPIEELKRKLDKALQRANAPAKQ